MTQRHLTGLLAIFLGVSCVAAATMQPLEGDPFHGRELLSAKLCTQCHSVWGHGGSLGPDISTAVSGKHLLDLVGDFWNHTPRMIGAMVDQGRPWPSLDREEMSDLLSYLYYVRLFDEPGDPVRGAIVYTQLQCGACHVLGGEGAKGGVPLDRFSAFPSPVVLAQSMWNAGPAMQRDQLRRGTSIPTFSGREMADLQAHIRARGLRTGEEVVLLPLPDPARGAEVFSRKRCGACHGADRGGAPDLSASVLSMTGSEISGILWNHSFAMNDRMRAMGIPFPRFQDEELADLVSYLHFLGFFANRGDAARGRSLFSEKGCSSCHEGPEARTIGATNSQVASDPIALSAAMWNHAPEMHQTMAEQSVAWPKFERGDMEDLAAYLRDITMPREPESKR